MLKVKFYFTNCAGLEADRVASFLGIDIAANHYEQHFWKGEYFAVSGKSNRINTLVYPVRDFIIREETDNGYPGAVNLLGIESPGLTSSLAIARYVRNLIK